MDYNFWNIFDNKILGLSIFSCLLAQLLKVITHCIVYKKFDITRFVETGGMPSSHSSSVATLSTCMGLAKGFGSCEFAACFVFSFICIPFIEFNNFRAKEFYIFFSISYR